MFFTLTPQQITAIKQNSFPTFEQVSVKNVIINNSGTDTVLKLTLEVKDASSQLKIFNNKKSQKLMKMKIFEILNEAMEEKALNCKTSLELDEVIREYGAYYHVLSPTDDFIGDKKDISQHKLDLNKNVTLQYSKEIILPEQVVKYFSLGVIFYYDLDTYIKLEKIQPEYIEKTILSSNIYAFKLIKDDRAYSDSINDLRLIKSIFNKQSNSNQSNLFLSPSDNSEYFKQQASLNFFNSLNSDLQIDTNSVKILSEKTKKIKIDTYFSNVYYSRNVNGNLSFLFNLDYQSLIQNNSAYKQQIINSPLKDEFSKHITLTSLKIKRRKIKKINETNNSKIYFLNDTVVNIVDAVDDEKQVLKMVSDGKNSFINEKAIYYKKDLDSKIRTFEVVDKEVFTFRTGLFQYGIELTLTDKFNSYIVDKLRLSLEDIKNLKSYLQETDSHIKTIKEYSNEEVVSKQIGVYDPTTNSFSRKFIEETYPTKHKDNVSNSITNFITLLNLFGIKSSISSDGLMLLDTFYTLLDPAKGSSETIILFIKTYERFVKQIQKMLSNNNSSEIKFEHWFSNEYVDASKNIDLGYEFVINEDEEGLGAVTVEQMNEIVKENIFKYSSENEIIDRQIDSIKYSYIAPKTVRVDNKVLDLNRLIDSPDSLSQYDFIEAEMDIKRYNGLGDVNQIMPTKNDPNLPSIRQQNLNLKLSALLNEFSVTVSNLLINDPKKIELVNKNADFEAAYNASADSSYLILSMSKLFDIKKGKFKQLSEEQEDFLDIERVLKQNKKYKTEIPMHLSLLISNKGKVLKSTDNYLSSVDHNSIFNIMYNTIQKIEYLEYNNNDAKLLDIKNEKWSLLTEDKIVEVDRQNKMILCRLTLYKNENLKISSFDQVELPIYNKYFILSGLDPRKRFRAPRPVEFDNFYNSIKEIVDVKIDLSLPKAAVIPKLPEKLPDLTLQIPKSSQLINALSPAAAALANTLNRDNPITRAVTTPSITSPAISNPPPFIDKALQSLSGTGIKSMDVVKTNSTPKAAPINKGGTASINPPASKNAPAVNAKNTGIGTAGRTNSMGRFGK